MKKNYYFMDLFNLFENFGKIELNNLPKENDSNFNKIVEEIENETHVIKNETWTSLDGTQIFKRSFMESKMNAIEKNIDNLRLEMKNAIEKEEFEKAAKIRDKIRKIK